jgi:pheromone shutdown protein TraB
LCGEEDEDLEHFLLRRQLLATTRQETIYAIDNEVNTIINRRMHQMSNEENIQIILDCSFLLNNDITMKLGYRKLSENKLTDLEFQCRRHLYNMYSARYRMMTLIRSRKR